MAEPKTEIVEPYVVRDISADSAFYGRRYWLVIAERPRSFRVIFLGRRRRGQVFAEDIRRYAALHYMSDKWRKRSLLEEVLD